MATSVTRPTFFEGEVLPAADLVASVDYARAQMARHERNFHIWGIASGLALLPPSGGAATLQPGVATDGTGRELVVASAMTLNPADFQSQVVPNNDPTTLYPVFLTGLDVPQTPTSNLAGACGTSQPTATQETCNITFGSPGSELDLDTQTNVGTADGPGDGVTISWKVLVGFVQWDANKLQFSNVATLNPVTKVGVRYIGVNASQVVSGSGSVLLATHPAGFSGPSAVLALRIQEDPNGGIAFGLLNPDGSITPTLTISPQGEIHGAVATGTVKVESGLASHGSVLPLPSGVTQAQVDTGAVIVHAYVSLRLTGAESSTTFGLFPLECYVDNTRRVHCRVRQLNLIAGAITDLPAVCSYVVLASVKSS